MATTTKPDDARETVRVLVVDTSQTAAEFVGDALEYAAPALSVDHETDAESALDRIVEEAFDAVVCEYHLGDEDGLSFLDRAREAAPDLRFVIHTMDDDPAVAEGAWNRGAAYAQKGHDIDRYDVIGRHLVGPRDEIEV
jgi:DNA-binding NarL/FixJ family response regulator